MMRPPLPMTTSFPSSFLTIRRPRCLRSLQKTTIKNLRFKELLQQTHSQITAMHGASKKETLLISIVIVLGPRRPIHRSETKTGTISRSPPKKSPRPNAIKLAFSASRSLVRRHQLFCTHTKAAVSTTWPLIARKCCSRPLWATSIESTMLAKP